MTQVWYWTCKCGAAGIHFSEREAETAKITHSCLKATSSP